MEPQGLPAVSMMEQLPVEIMTKVLDFAQPPGRLRVSMGNTVLNRLIMNECTELSETIDFSGYSEKRRDGLTDEMLAGLLIRVNARYVTKNLILRDCKNVQGTGLEPLRDSMVLERVDISCARRREGELNVILRWCNSSVR